MCVCGARARGVCACVCVQECVRVCERESQSLGTGHGGLPSKLGDVSYDLSGVITWVGTGSSSLLLTAVFQTLLCCLFLYSMLSQGFLMAMPPQSTPSLSLRLQFASTPILIHSSVLDHLFPMLNNVNTVYS